MSTVSLGQLYLVPTSLGLSELNTVLPTGMQEIIRTLRYFIAENPKTARAFLKQIGHPLPLNQITIETLNKDTPEKKIPALLSSILSGQSAGLLSEAGCPAVADPGALLVRIAHQQSIRVIPLVGPSAILLALMSSGMNGQRFMFHGYLPISAPERAKRIQQLEQKSLNEDATQIFIETPYRNETMFQAILQTCSPQTLLCVALDLTTVSEQVITFPIHEWRKKTITLNYRPCVFLIYQHSR
jgi:16S rRNA (cytidine1402-2'-O)-methyltransferase